MILSKYNNPKSNRAIKRKTKASKLLHAMIKQDLLPTRDIKDANTRISPEEFMRLEAEERHEPVEPSDTYKCKPFNGVQPSKVRHVSLEEYLNL